MLQDIQHAITDFYHTLHSEDEAIEINSQAKRICLSSVSKLVTEEQNTLLIQAFIIDDL